MRVTPGRSETPGCGVSSVFTSSGSTHNELNSRATVANHCDTLSSEVYASVPTEVVERGTRERVDTRNIWKEGLGKWTSGRDEHLCLVDALDARLHIGDEDLVRLGLGRPCGGGVRSVEEEGVTQA